MRNKYKAKRTEGYPSRLEYDLATKLKSWALVGRISELSEQARVELTDARISWKVDFKYWDNELRKYIWAEAKGFETSDYLIKKKLWAYYGPGTLHIYKRKGKDVSLVEEIEPAVRGNNS